MEETFLNNKVTSRFPFKIEDNYYDNKEYDLTFKISSQETGTLDGMNFFGDLTEIG